ncbi:hypothetical protein KR009_000802 [Drosophila setifemur]|nr:hypothetical protein KR009_000802 [Drosophila setifemur]
MGSRIIEIGRDRWPELRDLYSSDRTNLTGFDLLEYFINYKPASSQPEESIHIYSTDTDWIAHGNYILIHKLLNTDYVYFNTVKGSLEDLKSLLSSLDPKIQHLICGYEERFKMVIEQYWLLRGYNLNNLEHQGTIVYHLPSFQVETCDARLDLDHLDHYIVGYLGTELASLVDQHWTYRSANSLPLIRGFMNTNVSAGVFDTQGKPLAWCLRSPHGSLSNLHVLSSHRRKGLGSLAVRFMAQKIVASGSEVLATVVFENEGSQKMFEKLGFEAINKLYWAVVP